MLGSQPTLRYRDDSIKAHGGLFFFSQVIWAPGHTLLCPPGCRLTGKFHGGIHEKGFGFAGL